MAVQAIPDPTVRAVLTDWQTAPVDEKLRATLGFLQELTLCPTGVSVADVDRVRAAGVSDQARLADALDFDLTTAARRRVGGKVFYWLGYSRTSIPG